MKENQDLQEFNDIRKRTHERGTGSTQESANYDRSKNIASEISIVNEDSLPTDIPEEEKKRLFLFEMIDAVIEVSLLMIVYLSLQYFVVSPFIVSGASMEESFQDHELIMVNRIGYGNIFGHQIGSPERGDVIVFHPPIDTTEYYIKRIIGVPGDTVSYENNNVYLNGKLLEEPYTKCVAQHQANDLSSRERGICNYRSMEKKSFTVKPGEYYVMGDNRDHSSDSRSCFGAQNDRACTDDASIHFVPKANIIGKAWFVFWPFSQAAAHMRNPSVFQLFWPMDNIEIVKEFRS
ncbi:MAG: signal peptidase I [Candidatus Gracilibacteria bacterium]